MKKKILSIVIALALVLTLLPVTAFAAGNTVSTWAELSAAVSAAPTDGTAVTIKMTDDITAADKLNIPIITNITLDLNGKTLDLNAHNIGIGSATKFTIKDSTGGGVITGGSSDCGGCVCAVGGGAYSTVTLESGTIQSCTSTDPNFGGAAIYLNKKVNFIMNGGTIKDCTAANIGGAVYINSYSSFTMNGGTITGCQTTTGGGGAVFLGATGAAFNLHGGTITGCSATGTGGGVLVDNQGTFRMDGGTISECTSAHGGGIYVLAGGTFTMDDGTIYHCNAPSGGGVTVYGTFNLNGGVIDSCYKTVTLAFCQQMHIPLR